MDIEQIRQKAEEYLPSETELLKQLIFMGILSTKSVIEKHAYIRKMASGLLQRSRETKPMI
jgi:hypothetical protein